MTERKKAEPISFRTFYLIMVVLAILGLADSIYLSLSHYRVYTDMGYRSFCALSKAINCDTVSQSPYSVLLGIPVPVWGMLGYAFLLALLASAKKPLAEKKRLWTILCGLAGIYSLYSIVLALISTFLIHGYCLMCIVSYGINLALLYFVCLARKRFHPDGRLLDDLKADIKYLKNRKSQMLSVLLPFCAAVILVMIFLPDYWQLSAPAWSADIPTGVTKEGYPWIGAENAEFVITEFADYQCFQCKKVHTYLRQLIQKNPAKIKLIYRQFPMDRKFNPLVKSDFHTGSGEMALLAEYAKAHGKFWQMNDLLFELAGTKYINTRNIGAKVGLNYRRLSQAHRDPVLLYALKHDIAMGIKLGLSGTPGFVIDGKVYEGQIPPEIIRQILTF